MGILTFQAAAGGALNLNGPNIAGTVNLTLPSADGTSGQPLQTNGSGTLSFANLAIANGGTGATSFTANQIHYGSFSQSAGLTFDGTNFATTGTATAAKLIPTGTSVTGNGMYLPATNAVGISTAGTNAVYIDASQNVGIGTSSPAQKLEINGGAAAGFMRFASTLNSTGFDMGVGGAADPTAYIYNRNNTPLLFATNNTERMRIDSSGNLLVGTTLNQGTGRFSIIPNVSGNTCFNTQSTASNYYVGTWYTSTSTLAGYISVSGSVTTYASISDYRLKNSIEPITDALAKVAALKPVTYKWNSDGLNGQGFIAHELQEIVPDCVVGKKDAVDTNGNPVYQGVDTSFLVATLTAAIQEQQALITQLTDRIAALEAK